MKSPDDEAKGREMSDENMSDVEAGLSSDSNDGKHENFISNYVEMFKNKSFNPQSLLAPPLELIAKTGYTVEEPVLTGAPINFVKLEKLHGGKTRKTEKTNVDQSQKNGSSPLFESIAPPIGVCKPDVQQIR